MHAHDSKYVAGVLLLATLAVAACGEHNSVAVTAPTEAQSLRLTAEPASITPEFLVRHVCPAAPAFRTRFVIIVSGTDGLIVTGLHVGFVDRLGINVLPTVLTDGLNTSGSGSSLRTPPIPLPSSMPIPIPTSGPNDGLSVFTGRTERVPVTLEFGCNVRPHGTILVDADTRDHRGRSGRSRLTVEVGG